MRLLCTKDQPIAPRDTREPARQRLIFLHAEATPFAHARAQTTRTELKSRQGGRVRRVQLEEHVSVAARTLAVLQSLAARGPAQRDNDAA